jgi:hypothetical protein
MHVHIHHTQEEEQLIEICGEKRIANSYAMTNRGFLLKAIRSKSKRSRVVLPYMSDKDDWNSKEDTSWREIDNLRNTFVKTKYNRPMEGQGIFAMKQLNTWLKGGLFDLQGKSRHNCLVSRGF